MRTIGRETALLCLYAAFLLTFTSTVTGITIEGGVPAGLVEGGSSTFTNFPYVVSLRRRSDLGYFCAGVLIGTRHVLTAAHCLDFSLSSSDNLPQVVVGSASSSSTRGSGVQVLSTKKVIFHPGYQTQERSPDLAILELSGEANQKPVRLVGTFGFQVPDPVVILGWGAQDQGSGVSETLYEGSVGLTSSITCLGKYGQIKTNDQLCVRGPASTCPGDDGGPIVEKGNTRADDLLLGIVGSSHACGNLNVRPGVHTRAATFIGWMIDTIEGR